MKLTSLSVVTILVLGITPSARGFLAGVIPPPEITIYEYYNDDVNRYVLLNDPQEIAAVETGAEGPGWHRTGYSFQAYPAVYYAPGFTSSPVYRFYAPSVNSHFHTARPDEYQQLLNPELGWIFERIDFSTLVPQSDGTCAASLFPVWRLYNNRAQFADTDHRYTPDPSVHDSLVAQGWIDEGVNFCTHDSGLGPLAAFSLTPGPKVRSAADCSNEAINLGPCIGMNSLPSALPNRIFFFNPPDFNTVGPYSDAAYKLTGDGDDIYTAQPVGDEQAVLSHTFVQKPAPDLPAGERTPSIGMHATTTDATAPLASIDPMFQFTTSAPAAGQSDARVFPWRVPNEARLDLRFTLIVNTVKRGGAASEGWGASLVEFRDARSGQAIDVAVLLYGTIPPGDFVGVSDPTTGNVWVSTTVGETMLFGSNVGNGRFMPCDGTGPCNNSTGVFVLRLTSADFAGILTRARAVNPALSADVNDYMLVRYLLRNGVLGNAEVGASLSYGSLSLFGHY